MIHTALKSSAIIRTREYPSLLTCTWKTTGAGAACPWKSSLALRAERARTPYAARSISSNSGRRQSLSGEKTSGPTSERKEAARQSLRSLPEGLPIIKFGKHWQILKESESHLLLFRCLFRPFFER